MTKKIDWIYNRKACNTCKKARGFLEVASCTVAEWEDATKVKFDSEKALKLLKGMDKLVAIKGKKIVAFDLKKDRPGDSELLAHLIGPTGNLRAPTVRIGKVLLVGFNEDGYKEYLGV